MKPASSNMAERPILFSGEMVKAILDGRKTQTRRPLTPQPYSNGFKYDRELGDILCHNDYLPPSAMLLDVGRGKNRYVTSDLEDWTHDCPFGLAGDRLWVRETFYCDHVFAGDPEHGNVDEWFAMTYYRADYADQHAWANAEEWAEGTPPWTPSIHMPRWASRLTLEITEVRVERLQGISNDDALAEGMEALTEEQIRRVTPPGRTWTRGPWISRFECVWDASYAKSAPWSSNPFVWVLSFKRVESAERKAEAHG